MGSHSYTDICPKCGSNNFCCCIETRSIMTSGECHSCGYYIYPQDGMMTKEELEELQREDKEMED